MRLSCHSESCLILIKCSLKSLNLTIYFLPPHWTHYMPPSLYTPVFLCPTALTSTPTELMLSPSCVNHSIPQCPKALHSIPTEPPAEPTQVTACGNWPRGLLPSFYGRTFSVPLFPALTSALALVLIPMKTFLLHWVGREDGRKGLWVSLPLTSHTLFPLSPTTIVDQWLEN